MNCFCFDIETVPDTDFGRRFWDLDELSDDEIATAMLFKQQQKTGTDFLPLHMHRIVAISVTFRTAETFNVWSLGEKTSDESEIIQRFFDGIALYKPDLVSWNGSGFDLPVLHYRALRHSIIASDYWDVGNKNQNFKWNNYISRFHWRHIDLMDVLAGYQLRGRASLDQTSVLLGFPGKLGMSGSNVWKKFQNGAIGEIRDYCETDVLNTWLIYLRFEYMRGNLDTNELNQEYSIVHKTLQKMNQPHLNAFIKAWPHSNA